jgi:hypothetical protein
MYFYEISKCKEDIISLFNMSYLGFPVTDLYIFYGYKDLNTYVNITLS